MTDPMKATGESAALVAERYMVHHMAHDLTNHLGAIAVYLEMLRDDLEDPILRQRLEKSLAAHEMAKVQVEMIRHLIPRAEGDVFGLSSEMFLNVMNGLLGSVAGQMDIHLDFDAGVVLVGEPAILFYILYTSINFYLVQNVGERLRLSVVGRVATAHAEIRLTPQSASGANLVARVLDPERPGVSFYHVPSTQGGGFVLHWPISAL